MRTIPVFIPYVNRPDMLNRLLTFIPRTDQTEAIVINNSGAYLDISATVLTAPVPLTFTQTQNWMLGIAKALGLPFYLWGHCDAILKPDTVDRLYAMARDCRDNWGVIYTHYDIFCAYNTQAVAAIGGYDTLWFDYTSDQDFYRRMDLAGFARLESGLQVGHDGGSTTLNSDPEHSRRVGLQVPYRDAVYRAKWGGRPGEEVFGTPWNGVTGKDSDE